MKNPISTCSSPDIQKALRDCDEPKILQCLYFCYQNFQHHFFSKGIFKDDMIEIFWNAAYGFIAKNTAGTLRLATSLCAYFRGFMLNFIKVFFRKKSKNKEVELTEQEFEAPADPYIDNWALAKEEKEKVTALQFCISQLNPNYQIVIQGFYLGKLDREIAETLNKSPGAIAVMRKRSFVQLRKKLESDYPDLFLKLNH